MDGSIAASVNIQLTLRAHRPDPNIAIAFEGEGIAVRAGLDAERQRGAIGGVADEKVGLVAGHVPGLRRISS